MNLLQHPFILTLQAILLAALVCALYIIASKEKQLKSLRKSGKAPAEASEKEGFLREAAQISEEILDSAPVMYLLTVGSTVINSNKYARDIVGICPGDNVRGFYFDPAQLDKLSERLAHSDYILSENVQFITRANEVNRFLVNMSRIDSDGETGVVLWGINVEKSERRKDAVERTQKDMQMLINTLPLPLIIFDPVTLTTMYGNAAYASLLGQESPSGIIGREVVSLLFDESVKSSDKIRVNSLRDLVDRVINSGVPVEREMRHISPAGEVISTKAICTNFVYMGVYAILVIIQDISAEIKKAEMLSRTAEREREANELKSRFIVNMSHEIRTPLNAILGLSEIEMANGRDAENNVFKKIYTSAKSLLSIVNDILDFSKIESEKLDTDTYPFELEEVLAESLLVAAQRAQDKAIDIFVQVSGNLPHRLAGDKKLLWQALKNPLDNAAKYTDKGHITLTVKPAGEDGDGRVNIMLVIEDTGVGIKEEQLSRIFVPFEQFGANGHKHDGTGLGMSITKGVTDALGGTVRVESAYGSGTKVTLVLPFAPADSPASISEKNSLPFLENRSVLVVDSRKAVRDTVMEFLTSVRMTVYCVSNGEEAARAVKALEEEGRLLDIALVNYGGAGGRGDADSAVIREVSGSAPKIIALTPFAGDTGASPPAGELYDAYIANPFMPSALIAKIRETLEPAYDTADAPYESEDAVFENARVLLCEDNAINQDVAAGLLQIYGIEPVIAENGAEALALLEEDGFDLVFMDILMPVMTGHEATVKIRSSKKGFKDVPIVAMTANALAEEIDRCREEGMNGYIMKPIDAESLYRELLKWLPHRLAAAQSAQSVQSKPEQSEPTPTADASAPLAIPGIDAEDGLKRFAFKNDRYEKSLVKFAGELTESLSAIKNVAISENLTEGQFVAHKIKGIAGNLGAKELFERARELETAFAAGKNDSALINEFLESAEFIRKGITDTLISALPPSEESAPAVLGSAEEAVEALAEMKEGVRRFDPGMTESAVSRLKQKKWEGLDESILSGIYTMVENYQFEEAEEQINLLLEGLSQNG